MKFSILDLVLLVVCIAALYAAGWDWVQWFGPEAVGNFLTYIEQHGTRELRHRLAHISELNRGY